MTAADALLQAYQHGYPAEIEAAETAYQDAALAVYGDRRAVHHAEPPGYAAAFARVMDEMREIEDQARANPLPPPLVVEGDYVYLRADFKHGAPVDVLGSIVGDVAKRFVDATGDKSKAPERPGYRAFLCLVPVKP